MLARRAFTVLAAAFLVLAVALAAVLPPALPLGRLVGGDGAALVAVQKFELDRIGSWLWDDVTLPVLVRPSWLMPFALGLVCLGVVVTIGWRPARARAGK